MALVFWKAAQGISEYSKEKWILNEDSWPSQTTNYFDDAIKTFLKVSSFFSPCTHSQEAPKEFVSQE